MQMPGSMPFIQTIPTMQAVPASTSSGEMSLLISESKIHHGEIKSAVSRVTERIDDLILKVKSQKLNLSMTFEIRVFLPIAFLCVIGICFNFYPLFLLEQG